MSRVDVCVATECPRGPVRCVMSCAGSPRGGEGRRPRSVDGSVHVDGTAGKRPVTGYTPSRPTDHARDWWTEDGWRLGGRLVHGWREAGWMAGWMDGGHARPVGERRKAAVSHDAGSPASWRDPTPPNHNGVTTERRPPAGHLPPFKRHAPIHFDTVEYYEYSIVVRSS